MQSAKKGLWDKDMSRFSARRTNWISCAYKIDLFARFVKSEGTLLLSKRKKVRVLLSERSEAKDLLRRRIKMRIFRGFGGYTMPETIREENAL